MRRNLPTAVSLPDPVTDGPYTTPGQNGGFLGAGAAPFRVLGDPNDDDFRVDGLAGEPKRLADRRGAAQGAGQPPRPAGRPTRRRSGSTSISSERWPWSTSDETRRAFDLGREPDRVRERYGRHKYGQSLLLARRLVEAGVRLVTVYWGGKVNNPDPHWDTHFNNNRRLKEELLPPFDQCFSAFLEDLQARGLLESTLVIAMGEFGRTPRFGQFTGNGVNETGRDHWATLLLPAAGRRAGGRRPRAGPLGPLRRLPRRRSVHAAGPVRRRCCTRWASTPPMRCATPLAGRYRSARGGCARSCSGHEGVPGR